MLATRRSQERGYADHGWLQSHHTFSFAGYYDPNHMGFRSLRVMNEDRVAPGRGFGEHGHKNMEIVSYVLAGELKHKDSMGNGETLRPGEFQRITAGKGITHSEFNPSANKGAHFYQIWLLPEREGLEPGYEQRAFDQTARRDQWQLVASRQGHDGSLVIHQDARIYLADLSAGRQLEFEFEPTRYGWLQVLRGAVSANAQLLGEGDAAAISNESRLLLEADADTELMLFDLA